MDNRLELVIFVMHDIIERERNRIIRTYHGRIRNTVLFSLLLFISRNLIIILSINCKGLSRNRYCFVW